MGDGAAALRGMGREELERRSVREEVTGNAFVPPAKPGQMVHGMPAPQGVTPVVKARRLHVNSKGRPTTGLSEQCVGLQKGCWIDDALWYCA